jgi:predicted nucleic acid-binding protein
VKLAADASAVVAESLRSRGRRLISHADRELYATERTWSEIVHEIGRRIGAQVRHGRFTLGESAFVHARALALLTRKVTIVTEAEYGQYEAEARDRIPQDSNDWPTVALALSLDIGIWASDRDFFGCGVPVWTTDTLLTHLVAGRGRG